MRDSGFYGAVMAMQEAREPQDMRAVVRSFVISLHSAYAAAAALLAPGERAALPLFSSPRMRVVAAAAGNLHVIATTDPLPAPRGQEVEVADALDDFSWTLRFYDAVVLPALGGIDESAGPDTAAVRRALGLVGVVYHLSVGPGGDLSEHHAQHAGTGLAHQHAASFRDAQTLLTALPHRRELVDELTTAERLGLSHSMRLLAHELAPDDDQVAAAIAGSDDALVRRALVAATRKPSPALRRGA
jgi:hypothetical protein